MTRNRKLKKMKRGTFRHKEFLTYFHNKILNVKIVLKIENQAYLKTCLKIKSLKGCKKLTTAGLKYPAPSKY